MIFRRGMIILNGLSNKGFVRFSTGNSIKGECVLEHDIKDGVLFFGAENAESVALDGIKTRFDMRKIEDKPFSCLVRGNGVTLFGKENGGLNERDFSAHLTASIKNSQSKSNSVKSEPQSHCDAIPSSSTDAVPSPPADAETSPSLPGDVIEPAIAQVVQPPLTDATSADLSSPSALNKRAEEIPPSSPVSHVLDDGKYVGDNFYKAVKPQLDEMFVCFPAEQKLNDIVPNSKWLRVDSPDGAYVVGVLFDVDEPLFICYGVPGRFTSAPPLEIADVCVWLPLDLDHRDLDGYWIIYQDARTGRCIR